MKTDSRSPAQPYRILLLEDNYEQARLLIEFLQISGSFRVDWTENIRGLWDFLERGEHDILLMDYRLPDGTGLDALAEMRRQGCELPVIMITGQGDERLAVQAMQLGAVDYLVKGSDFLPTLPSLIQKAIQAHELQLSVQRSLEKVRYQALLLSNVRDAVVVWNTEGTITYWNPAAEALFEWKASERLGQSVEACYLSTFYPAVRIPQPEETSGQEIERRCLTRSGRPLWISSRVSALRDYGAGGRLIGYMDVSRDITARKRAEAALVNSNKALKESEARYRAVSELISDFVYALRVGPDRSITCEWITDAFEHVTGYTPNEIDWQNHWQNLVHEDDNSDAKRFGTQLLSGKKGETELRIVTKSGEVRWVRNYAQPVWDEAEGRVVRIYGAAKDITERKQMEAQIQAAQTRLTQSARLAAVGELASGVAHHINNPLTTIIAEAQILLHTLPVEHAGRESAEAIEQAGWRVQKAVQQLLDFSRPGTNTLEKLSVNDTISGALNLIADQILASGVQLEVELNEELPALSGNRRQLCDLWVNLLMLAQDATSDGLPHTIRVRSTSTAAGLISVEISDDGTPIPARDLPALFEPNFIHPIGGRGTGIELNICQEIVRQHKGQISATSCPETGTTFCVQFPVEEYDDGSQHLSH